MSTQAADPMTGGRRWLSAIAVVLVIPLVAFVIAIGVHSKYQGDLITAVEQEAGRSLTADERSTLDIDAVCIDPEVAGEGFCQDVGIAGVTRLIAIAGGVIGAALLALVAFLRARARRDRDSLLRLFRPGLYLTLVGLTLLVILDGILAIAGIYLGLGVFAGRIFPILMLAVAFGVLAAVVGIIRAALRATRRATSRVVAQRLDPTAQPAIHELVRDLAATVGTEAPDHVLVGLDPDFFVTEVDVEAIDGRWRGRSLYLSLPVSRIVTVPELSAIVGHEMGHYRGSDTAYSRRFYPIYRGASDAIAALVTAGGESGARSLALIPAAIILGLFIEGFANAERSISRDRELIADKAGAEVASARDLGSSLVKLTAFSEFWGTTLEALVGATEGSPAIPNASDAFIGFVRAAAAPSILVGLDAREIPHPTDSHPPLSDRLTALGTSQADVEAAAIDVDPSDPAGALINDRAAIEIALTSWIGERIAVAAGSTGAAETAPPEVGPDSSA